MSIDITSKDSLPDESSSESFFTSLGELENSESRITTGLLADNSFRHWITSKDDTITLTSPKSYSYNTSTGSRYNDTEFKGLLIDSGAATRSTGGISQFKALQQLDKLVKLDESTAGSTNFVFGIGSTTSIGTVRLDIPIEAVTFHIIQVNTPFLLCLADIDKLGVFFNNITNELVQSNHSYPIVRRYGHAFLPWYTSAYSVVTESLDQNPCYLTDVELIAYIVVLAIPLYVGFSKFSNALVMKLNCMLYNTLPNIVSIARSMESHPVDSVSQSRTILTSITISLLTFCTFKASQYFTL